LMDPQEHVWNREYGRRGTLWGKKTKGLPLIFRDKLVLEVGSGNGKTLLSILEQEPRFVAAIDFSHQALKLCGKKWGESEVLALERANILGLPFADNTFDAVVLYYVLDNMLAHDRIVAVSEAKRVLQIGGMLAFEDFAVGDFRESTAKRVDVPETHTILKKKGLLCHYFTEEEALKLFGGFKNREVAVVETRPIKNKEHLVRRIISGVMEK
jgi:ubiquinone/menaquinone biosynthesis C-methylase UbiE